MKVLNSIWVLPAFLVLASCTGSPSAKPQAVQPRLEATQVAHPFGGQVYSVAFLPDAPGMTFVTADGEVLSASEPPTARLAVSGGGLTRKDYFPALRVVADLCRARAEYACRAFARDNGGPIFVEGRWLFQFPRTGDVS